MRQSLRKLTFGAGKSGGRNSSGRITAFHRGGGSKRLQRRIDLKRSTSSMGIVERIEYDPNRSSRIALVRWIQGVHHHHHHDHHHRKCNAMKELLTPPRKVPESTTAATATATATISSLFSFSSLPGPLSSKSQASAGSKMTCAKDVFFSAFSSQKAKAKAMGETASSLSLPRIAVAGAKPAFFAPRMREEALGGKNTFSIGEVGKWRRDSILWAHRIKRKAAISWQGFRRQETL